MTAAIGETVSVGSPTAATSRTTRQGRAVERELGDADAFLSAQDLHALLRDHGEQVGLATVYRHLQKLTESGVVDAVTDADGQVVYRRCGAGAHHHHLVCRTCRRSLELESADVEQWASQQASALGFTDVEHTLEIFGTCPDCRRATRGARRAT